MIACASGGIYQAPGECTRVALVIMGRGRALVVTFCRMPDPVGRSVAAMTANDRDRLTRVLGHGLDAEAAVQSVSDAC